MSATVTPLEQDTRNQLKDFLIFRVDDADGHCELADDSTLEGEAVRYADLVADAEPEHGIHYEVYGAGYAEGAAEPLYSTGQDTGIPTGATWTPTATW